MRVERQPILIETRFVTRDEYRRRKKLGPQTRTVRVAPKQVTKLIELGHNPAPPQCCLAL